MKSDSKRRADGTRRVPATSLKEYHKKRRFSATPEPEGKVLPHRGDLRFVVQKHDASRLHYDFRLELDGVLKSWAVPKGPSLNPHDKRLAVMVEDHPLDYRTFEGIIPEGNYGAGTVMVWDEGTYGPPEGVEPGEFVQTMRAGLAKGHIRFALYGIKLKGEFSLVRLKSSGQEKNWLLFKHTDSFATDKDVSKEDRSALSGRNLPEIAKHAPAHGKVWQSNRQAAGKKVAKNTRPKPRPRARSGARMPHKVKPMLATLIDKPFNRQGWLFEIKWDGYRAIAEVEADQVRLYSRNLLPFEKRFPSVVQALADLGHDVVLDGEVVALDDEGKSQFQLLQAYQKTGRGNLVYYIFDLLYLDGEDLRALPLATRKQRLAALIGGDSVLRLSEHIADEGLAFFEAVSKQGLEGMIAKNGDSPYREGVRSADWLKIKARKQQEAVIGGFTEPRGSRRGLGALVVGTYEGKDLIYRGHAGGGFNDKMLLDMRAKLEPLEQAKCPFKIKPKTNAPVHWVRPELVCEVVFHEWTDDGLMRQPVFLGLREDKPASGVKREIPKPQKQALKKEKKPKATSRSTTGPPAHKNSQNPKDSGTLPGGDYTHVDKIYWPEDGYTKGDLLRYYHEVSSLMLPYLRDRPMSLNRHPNGIHGPNFFQKDVKKQPPPDWIRTAEVSSDTRGTITYMLCQDEAALLYMANLGCIEINPWNSRLPTLENPDYLIIDLDPQDVPFPEVIEAAQKVRRLLEKGCADSYCKTSGKRGLHVYIPLGARYDYDQSRQFAEVIARLCQQLLPETTSVIRSPAKREKRVYLDFLQNRRGQTMAAPYSVRPTPGACVSTPLHWKEVNNRLDPAQFTIKTVPRRLDKVGDLWKAVLGPGLDLEKCLRSLEKTTGQPKS